MVNQIKWVCVASHWKQACKKTYSFKIWWWSACKSDIHFQLQKAVHPYYVWYWYTSMAHTIQDALHWLYIYVIFLSSPLETQSSLSNFTSYVHFASFLELVWFPWLLWRINSARDIFPAPFCIHLRQYNVLFLIQQTKGQDGQYKLCG